MLLASIWDVSASLRCTVIVCGTHFTQGQSPSSYLLPLLCCILFLFVCVCLYVCACMCVLVCIKETRQLSTIQLPNFLRRLKWKSANFSDIIHLYSVCLLTEAAVFSFLPPIIPRQWLTSLAWHLCTEAHSPASDGERYFRAYCRAAVMQSPLFLHLLPLRLPHQQCNKCAPLFFASPA